MFWVLLVFIFTDDPIGLGGVDMAQRQVLQPKFEATRMACTKDALEALNTGMPIGVHVGVKCDGPFMDPTVTKLPN